MFKKQTFFFLSAPYACLHYVSQAYSASIQGSALLRLRLASPAQHSFPKDLLPIFDAERVIYCWYLFLQHPKVMKKIANKRKGGDKNFKISGAGCVFKAQLPNKKQRTGSL